MDGAAKALLDVPIIGFTGRTIFGESRIIDVKLAIREVYITQEVRNYYPPIAGIINYLACGVTQGVPAEPDYARLVLLSRQIIDSLITFGYVALYLDRFTNEIGVVPPFCYLAITAEEYRQITGRKTLPREHVKRRNDKRIIRTHIVYFPSSEDEERFFHPTIGAPLLFMGDWMPIMGIPTTPCHGAVDAMKVRHALIKATYITAIRSGQPPQGYVMTMPVGGIGGIINSLSDINGAVGTSDVLRHYDDQADALQDRNRDVNDKARERLLSYSLDGVSASEISSLLEPGGTGQVSWAPRVEPRELDVSQITDVLASEIATLHGVPPRRLNLRIVAIRTSHTSLGDAAMGFEAISSMRCHTQNAIDIFRELVALIEPGIQLLKGDLKPNVPPEMMVAVEPVLSGEGRRTLYAEMMRVPKSYISSRNIEEIKGEYLVEVAKQRSKRNDDDADEPPRKKQKA